MDLQPGTNLQEYCENQISQIAKHLIAGRVGFLFGSGMSNPSGGISGEELAYQLVWKAFYPKYHLNKNPVPPDLEKELRRICGKYPLEALAEGAMKRLTFQESELESILKASVFADREPSVHEGHTHLASLVKKLHVDTLYTTNWDNLIQAGLGASGRVITESKLRLLEDTYRDGLTAILHLHGTFDDSPLVREKDLMDPERPLLQLFLADLITKAFVFVGYSLNDFNIKALYSKSRDVLARRSTKLIKSTYVVAPAKTDAEADVASEVWRSRDAIYLPMGAVEFFRQLYKEVVTNALDDLRGRLRRQLGNVSLVDLQAKIESIMNVFPEFQDEAQVLRYLDAASRGGK